MDPGVPLVIPEVNPEAMADVRLGKGAIVANPNCSTIICLMAVTPLHRHAKVPLRNLFLLRYKGKLVICPKVEWPWIIYPKLIVHW
jgi:hypothetical protein